MAGLILAREDGELFPFPTMSRNSGKPRVRPSWRARQQFV